MIGKILKRIRIENQYSQDDIAKLIKTDRSTISNYERNSTDPNYEIIEKISNICEYEIIFRNKRTGEILTSKNIERKEI